MVSSRAGKVFLSHLAAALLSCASDADPRNRQPQQPEAKKVHGPEQARFLPIVEAEKQWCVNPGEPPMFAEKNKLNVATEPMMSRERVMNLSRLGLSAMVVFLISPSSGLMSGRSQRMFPGAGSSRKPHHPHGLGTRDMISDQMSFHIG